MLKKRNIIPAVLWGFIILYLTIIPKSHPDTPLLFQWMGKIKIDKIAHFVFWGLWYVIYHITFVKHNETSLAKSDKNKIQIRFLIFAVIFGIGIEILQLKLNWGRSAELLDIVADSLGVLTAYALFKLFKQ